MNIILISHCNFLGNSAMHVFSVARELCELGHECVVLVPDTPDSILFHSTTPPFAIFQYAESLQQENLFSKGAVADIIHAWTPRTHIVRIATALREKHKAKLIVHMEDNEEQIVLDELANKFDYDELRSMPAEYVARMLGTSADIRSLPHISQNFIQQADGLTALIDKLLEYAAPSQPKMMFWPGYDPAFEADVDAAAVRERYGVVADEIMLLYCGNVHGSIVDEIRELYIAAAILRRRGVPVRLLRTGWDYADLGFSETDLEEAGVVNLGFLERSEIPVLVNSADILVQPGAANPFNNYRFPSKLTEFLISGRPVILPNSNIGRVLEDGKNAIKLREGDAFDIANSILRLLGSPDRGAAIGAAGKAFAQKNLSWKIAAKKLERFYASVITPITPTYKPVKACADTIPAGKPPVDVIAFYLPQFHTIPENDKWWGQGFTEWANVVRAPQNLKGQDQPRLPTDLGFYDLRNTDIMHKQAALARKNGVSGFCFYYYWFDGRRLLETPLDQWLESGPDFDFCICWANEPWSRRWDGSSTEVLMEQPYSDDYARKFFMDVLPILQDDRYIKVDGKPLLAIYKISDIPDAVAACKVWRQLAREHGLDGLHIVAIQSFGIGDPRPYGADAAIEFSPPHVNRHLIDPANVTTLSPDFTGYLEDYIGVARNSINRPPSDYTLYRGLFPRWDNSARRKEAGHILINESPKAYGSWLRFLTHETLLRKDRQHPFLFINAWNKWAEGAYLEPDEAHGHQYLEVTREALIQGCIDYVGNGSDAGERRFVEAISRLKFEKDRTLREDG